ncbi:MAG: triose-phosphate isomerase [Firmicutes bacterium]|nr:triose-phosphate isomerase [Bacillota bacterium]
MSARRPLVAGNWKMHKTVGEALGLVNSLLALLPGEPTEPLETEIVVCPPFTALWPCAQRLAHDARVRLGAQDVFWETEGAYTGAVSPRMLADAGCAYVIVGHSERRAIFRETDEEAARKAAAAAKEGLHVIFCVGETLEERDADRTREVVARQLAALWAALPAPPGGGAAPGLSVAYEPVWAIGTGRAARPEDAAEVAGWIRESAAAAWGRAAAEALRVLYGGSVSPENAAPFLQRPELDGALVGGKSLDARAFAAIVAAARDDELQGRAARA